METTPTKPAVKKVYPKYVRFDLTRHDAVQLMKLLKKGKPLSDSTSLRIRQSFRSQLEAEYEGSVQCTDCRNKFVMIFRSLESVRTTGICASCSDDYK